MLRNTPSLALFFFITDAFSRSTESACVEVYLACYDLFMFTSQKMSFQADGPDLAVLGCSPSEQRPHPQQTLECNSS